MSRRAQVLFYATVYGFVFLFLVIFFSHFAFPPDASPDGRLRYARNGDLALSFNNVKLAQASQRGWHEIELAYRLEPEEVLHFLFHRQGDDFLDFRLSRAPDFDSALLTFRTGRLVDKRSLAGSPPPAEGIVRFTQTVEGVAIAVDGRTAMQTAVPEASGSFEIVLTPQNSNRIFHRVRVLREIMVTGGESPRSYGRTLLRSVPAMALFAGLLLAPFVWWSRRRLAWWFAVAPYRPVLLFLVCLDAILAFVAVYFHRVFLELSSPNFPGDFIFRAMVVVFIGAAFLLMRLAVRRPRRQTSGAWFRWTKRAFFMPAALTVLAVITVALSLKFLMSIAPEPKEEAAGRAEHAPVRILCYGGSSTGGFPFPRDWPFTYPPVMQELLRRDLDPAAEVLNLGVNAKKINYILSRMKEDLPRMQPSHVIVNSVQNNRNLSDDKVRRQFVEALELCRQYDARPVLALEPSYYLVGQTSGGTKEIRQYRAQLEAKYALLRELAREQGVLLIDPAPLFRAHKDEFLFLDGSVHFTKYGHALMAQALADGLFPPLP
ncbi:MAG TPA: GDSL-type esterase/lipase family protein [bacterium]|mgnify:CR=1 FL=1|nr:GDSL-type esterase/lipase family protein [bacterium]